MNTITVPAQKPSPVQRVALTARINRTATKIDGRKRKGRSRLPKDASCQICEIGIFSNQQEAARLGTTFDELINLRVGNTCVGCAGTDTLRIEQMADLIPAPQPVCEKISQELMTAHQDYLVSGDTIAAVQKRHGLYQLAHKFRTHGLAVRKPGRAAKKKEIEGRR